MLPPSSLVWLERRVNSPSLLPAERALLVETLDARAITSFAGSKHYTEDVITLACLARGKTVGNGCLPSLTNYDPCADDSDRVFGEAVKAINYGTRNPDAFALYAYVLAAACLRQFSTALIESKPRTRLSKIMANFAVDCKFKTTGDLFIWNILHLNLPSWLAATKCFDERPYVLAPRVYGSGTNEMVQPWIKRSVVELLAAPLKPYERFCILAALAIELQPTGPTTHVNADVCKCGTAPTPMALAADLVGGEVHEFGYVANGVLFKSDTPLQAVAAWVIAVDETSPLAEICDDDRVLSGDNPFAKFLA